MVVKVHVFSLFVMFVLINSSFLLHHNRDGYLKITDFGFAKIVTYKVSPLSLLVLSLPRILTILFEDVHSMWYA